MSAAADRSLILVLSGRRAFEKFTGPVPERLESRFRFTKPRRAARIRALLPHCALVISKSYLQPAANRWIFAARRSGIPTLLLVDGPLEWSNSHANPNLARRMGDLAISLMAPLVHDGVAAIGPAQSRWIAGQNRGRPIQLMSYANQRIRKPATDLSPTGSGVTELDFLVTTAKTPYFDEAEKAELLRVLSRCCSELEKAGLRYALRIFDEGLARELPSERIDTRGDFAEALARARCVIGTPSSVLLEAMQHGKPTATLMFRDSPLFYQTGWLLGCTTDWEPTLRSMLDADPERMELQRYTLQENLSEEDFFACCERFLDRVAAEGPRPLDGEDLAFENRLLHRLLGWRARLAAPCARPRADEDDD